MFYSIRTRICVFYVLLVLLVILGLSVYVINFVKNASLSDLELRLLNQAQLVADQANPLMQGSPDPALLDPLARRLGDLIQSRLTLISSTGEVLGDSAEDRTKMDNHLSRPEITQAKLTGKGKATRFSKTEGIDMFYVAVPIRSGDQIVGYARVALSLQAIEAKIARLRNALVAAALISAAVAVLLAGWISSRVTRPLNDLIATAGQMAHGRLESHLIPSGHDEISQLTENFNDMAQQLNQRFWELEAERSRMGAVLNGMTDGVMTIDSENRICSSNPAFDTMFGLEAGQAAGESVFEIVRHHQLADILDRMRSFGETQSELIEIGAQRMVLHITASPLSAIEPTETLLIFHNLTRLRRLETIRQDFISNISHELRTPLASLKALTETLHDTALDDPPAARHFLDQMDIELDSLSQMVEELLELSRIESGRVPLKLSPTAPKSLITQSVDRLASQAERAGMTVTVNCQDDLPMVNADPPRLQQVLVNLLHNAIKFSPAGSQITLAAAIQKKDILFSVQDYGVGIPVKDLPRIFERFYKTDRARASGGTGLGLAISRHLVEAHGGVIWVESLEGQGSTFFFTIPQAE